MLSATQLTRFEQWITFERLFRVSQDVSVQATGQRDPLWSDRPETATHVHVKESARISLVDIGNTCGLSDAIDAGTCWEDAVSLSWHERLSALLDMGSSDRTAEMRCLPNFLLVGVQKAATGSLSTWLSSHPVVRRGNGRLKTLHGRFKEGHFFDTVNYNPVERSPRDALAPHWRGYFRQFPRLSHIETIAGVTTFEKTPSYCRFPRALILAKYLIPSTRIVVILREPIGRAYSAFCHHVRHRRFCALKRAIGSSNQLVAGTIRTFRIRTAPHDLTDHCDVHIYSLDEATACASFEDIDIISCWPGHCAHDFDRYVKNATVAGGIPIDLVDSPMRWTKRPRRAIDVVADGDYAPQLQHLFNIFPSQQVHVLLFEDVINNPIQTLTDLQERLDLQYHDFSFQLREDRGRLDLSPRGSFAIIRDSLAGSHLRRWKRYSVSKPGAAGNQRTCKLVLAATHRLLRHFYAPRFDLVWDLLRNHGKLMIPPPWLVCRVQVNESLLATIPTKHVPYASFPA